MPSVTAILVAGLAGQLSAAVVGILPWAVLPVTAVLLVVLGHVGLRADDRRAELLRKGATVVALVVSALSFPSIVGVADPQRLKGSLGLLLVAIQVCQAVGWRSPRERRGGVLTALGVLVLAASYAPDVLVGLPLVVGWVAVLVALGQLGGSRARQLTPAVAVAVALGLVAYLLIPAPVSAGVRSRLAARSGESPVAGRSEAGALAFSSGSLDLRTRGALSPAAVLEVPSDSPALWRSTTYDTYDGTGWTTPSSVNRRGDGPRFEVSQATGPTRTDTAKLRVDSQGTVWSPGLITSITAPGTGFASRETGEAELPGLTGSYTVTSDAPVSDDAVLRSQTGADNRDERWRLLPTRLPGRVRALALQLAAGTGSRWGAAEAIAAYLRTNATYRLDSPVPGPDEDAVDRFLFTDRTGFCEQFASAEAVLLRTLGIPARLVTGLAYGTPDGGHRLYRGTDLHAWVELWVPGVGWVSSDPTAGVPLAAGAGTGSLRQRVAAQVTHGLRALTRVPGGRPTLAALLLAVVLVGLLVRRRPRRVVLPVTAEVSAGPALAAFLRFDARLGASRRRPGESLRELRARLSPVVSDALQVVEQECYAPVAPDPRGAVEVLDRS